MTIAKPSNFADARGMKSLELYFPDRAAKEKENMGLSSNLRKSTIKKAKSHANKKKTSSPPKISKQKTLNGKGKDIVEEPRVDKGTKVCRICEAAKNGQVIKSKHDDTCPRSDYYKRSGDGQKTDIDMAQEPLEKAIYQKNNRPFEGKEIHSRLENKITQHDVDSFILGKGKKIIIPPSSPGTEVQTSSTTVLYYTEKLKNRIDHFIQHPTHNMKNSKSVPAVIGAAIETLFELQDFCFKANSNILMAGKNSKAYDKLLEYQKVFPPGTTGFKFPRDNK